MLELFSKLLIYEGLVLQKNAIKIFVSESILEIFIPRFVKITFTRVTPKHLHVVHTLKIMLQNIFFIWVMQRHITFVLK